MSVLPAAEFDRLAVNFEKIELKLGAVLYEAGEALRYVYFPATCIVSLLYVMEDGKSAKIAVIGNDGIVGIAVFLGGKSMPNRAVVHCAGYAYRLKAQQLMNEFTRCGGRRSGNLKNILLRYTQDLITQMIQTAACNRHHSVDQQLCRWLLLSLDRLSSNELVMTPKLIADMLGVCREGVTEAAGNLQSAGLISYSRGRIEVLNKPGLEARVCECYQTVKTKTKFKRLLPLSFPHDSVGEHAKPEEAVNANLLTLTNNRRFPSG